MIRHGEIYSPTTMRWSRTRCGRLPQELNRGNWVAAVLITSKRFEERSKQPHCVPFRAGEFGLSRDCVAKGESLFSIRREELGDQLGTLDDERWCGLVKALGNMMGSDCEPIRSDE